jgi:hypothetical protein
MQSAAHYVVVEVPLMTVTRTTTANPQMKASSAQQHLKQETHQLLMDTALKTPAEPLVTGR